MKNHKQALTTLSLSVLALLYSSSTLADVAAVSSGFPDISYQYKDNKLHEKFGDFDSIAYSKASLPKSCLAISIEQQKEKYQKQPSADIVGSWKMDEEDSALVIDGDGSYVVPSYFINIKNNGEIASYDFFAKEQTCELITVNELNGNKLSYHEPAYDVALTKVKVTNIDKQLAVINVFKETYTDEGKEQTLEYAQAHLYDAVNAVPQKCDIAAAKPAAEKSNDNPNASIVGNWLDTSQQLVSAEVTLQQYFVLTADGFMFSASYEKAEQNEGCYVEFIGEVAGDTYTK